jgi:hypothetical protein
MIALGWPLMLDLMPAMSWAPNPLRGSPSYDGLALASPFFGVYATTEWAGRFSFASNNYSPWGNGPGLTHGDPTWPLIWIAFYLAVALILALATTWTFDRCLGRISGSHRLRDQSSKCALPKSIEDLC